MVYITNLPGGQVCSRRELCYILPFDDLVVVQLTVQAWGLSAAERSVSGAGEPHIGVDQLLCVYMCVFLEGEVVEWMKV